MSSYFDFRCEAIAMNGWIQIIQTLNSFVVLNETMGEPNFYYHLDSKTDYGNRFTSFIMLRLLSNERENIKK